MFEKIWDDHVVHAEEGKQTILYVDLQLVHEVTSAQAFEGLRLAGRKVRRPGRTVATLDHNVPTTDRLLPIVDPVSKLQVETLRENCRQFGIRLYDLDDPQQGIVHVIGPELGLTQPGMTIVCGDSHTATHGAFGALAFGIGTSEVEHVLATQTLLAVQAQDAGDPHRRPAGPRGDGQGPDPLHHRPDFHPAAARATAIEYTGETIRGLSMEERMTVCNMSIEAGARAGLIAPDETTYAYLRGRPFVPGRLRGGGGAVAEAARRSRRRLTTASRSSRPPRFSRKSPGGPTPARSPTSAAGCRIRPASAMKPSRNRPRCRPGVHGPGAGHPDRRDWRSIASSSAPAPTAGSKTCGRPRPWSADTAWPRASRRWSCPAADWSSSRPSRRAGPGLHGRRLRVARGRLQHVPGDEPRQARARRALRVDQQPQLRGPSRQGRADAPGLARHGRRGRRRRPFRRTSASGRIARRTDCQSVRQSSRPFFRTYV